MLSNTLHRRVFYAAFCQFSEAFDHYMKLLIEAGCVERGLAKPDEPSRLKSHFRMTLLNAIKEKLLCLRTMFDHRPTHAVSCRSVAKYLAVKTFTS